MQLFTFYGKYWGQKANPENSARENSGWFVFGDLGGGLCMFRTFLGVWGLTSFHGLLGKIFSENNWFQMVLSASQVKTLNMLTIGMGVGH